MASLTVVWSPVYRDKQVVKVTPATPLSAVLDEVCAKQNFRREQCRLEYKRKRLDLSLTFRFANLPAGATLDLVICDDGRPAGHDVAASAPSAAKISVACQLPDGSRATALHAATTSLWEVLERTGAIRMMADHPSGVLACAFTNNEIVGEEALARATLWDIGLTTGSGLLRTRILTLDGKSIPVPASAPVTLPAQTRAPEVAEPVPERAESPRSLTTSPVVVATSDGSSVAPSGGRDVVVLKPFASFRDLSQIELPESFYEMDEQMARRAMVSYVRNLQELENAPLQTRAMREREDELRLRKFPRTIIRVTFPNHITLQGTFASTEPISSLHSFVLDHIAQRDRPFYLFVTPPRRVLAKHAETLAAAGLAPSAIVHFSWDGGVSDPNEPYLRAELLESAREPPAPQDPLVTALGTHTSELASEKSDDPLHIMANDGDEEDKGDAPSSSVTTSSAARPQKVPKWLKLGH